MLEEQRTMATSERAAAGAAEEGEKHLEMAKQIAGKLTGCIALHGHLPYASAMRFCKRCKRRNELLRSEPLRFAS